MTNTLYVPLEEVLKIWRYPIEISHMTQGEWYNALADTENLQTIDPIATIDEMINERRKVNKIQGTDYEGGFEISALEELKQLLLNK